MILCGLETTEHASRGSNNPNQEVLGPEYSATMNAVGTLHHHIWATQPSGSCFKHGLENMPADPGTSLGVWAPPTRIRRAPSQTSRQVASDG